MASKDTHGLNRRAALSTLAAAAAGAAIVAAADPVVAAPAAPGASAVGLRVANYRVTSETTRLGAVILEVANDEADRFTVLVCAKGGAQRGVAETEQLALFVRNDGSGEAPTHELHGRIVMALADLLRPHDASYAARGLLTLSERVAQHGGAVGL